MVWQMTSEYSSHICRSPIIISVVIEMNMVKDYLSLTIRNKMDPSMQDKALTIRTTKADKKQHGLGRQIIDDIVRRYNGCTRFL